MSQKNAEFSRLRSFFWPVHRHEIKKFVPMICLFFFISFNYHLLRIAKDTLIITAPLAGAEAIPFLKVWGILPSAIFFTFLFTRFSNRFNRENVFYLISTIFLIFFLIFIFILYPLKDKLFLNSLSDYLQTILPKGLNGFVSIIRYWIYSLFYIMAEAWSTIMLSLLLWGFANDVNKVSEAKRFYALFGIGINSAGIFAGQFGNKIASHMQTTTAISPITKFFGVSNSWDQTLLIFIGIIITLIICSISIYRYLHVKFFKERSSFAEACPLTKKPKNKLSLRKNLKCIIQSKYLLFIAILVLSYNIIINFSEILWKSQMKELFPSPGQYTAYMSKIIFFIGIIATLGSYFFSGTYIRKFGWKATALLTPIIEAITGAFFFYFLFVKYYSTSLSILGFTPLAICVFFGSLQNILSRSAKYTVFDNTKEMAFIPLSDIDKIKGKSAIDGIGSRLGKSGSSLILQILLLIFSTPIACCPIIIPLIFAFILPSWIYSINSLNKKFTSLEKKETSEVSLAQN